MSILAFLIAFVVSGGLSVIVGAAGLKVACAIFNIFSRAVNATDNSSSKQVVPSSVAQEELGKNPYQSPRHIANSPKQEISQHSQSVANFSFTNACSVSFFLMLLRSVMQVTLSVLFGFGNVSVSANEPYSGTFQMSLAIGALAVHFVATSGFLTLFLPTNFSRALVLSLIFHALLTAAIGLVILAFALLWSIGI